MASSSAVSGEDDEDGAGVDAVKDAAATDAGVEFKE